MAAAFQAEPRKDSPEGGTFQKDITYMLHGFGDGPTPLPATVALVESIVLRQLREILHMAGKISEQNGHKSVLPEDIIFLMRKNKVKLQRLLQYMNCKRLCKIKKGVDDQFLPTVMMEEDDIDMGIKKKNLFNDIIEALDDTGTIAKSLEYDGIVEDRKMRANKISQCLSLEKYEAYHKARCASFGQGKISLNKLKQWICPLNDMNLSVSTLELLSYLAYESVAQIVDLVFLVRQDSRNILNEPFTKLEGGNYCNPLTFDNTQNIKTGQGVNPITVAQVREAMRRFNTPRIGINGLFYRNVKSDMPMKFLAI